MSYPFALRQVYNFDVYAPAIIKNNFKGVTILGIVDYDRARREIDVDAMHISIYPHLPAGTPNDPRGYDYVIVKYPNGNTTVLGLAWINEDTIQVVESRTISVKIGGVTAADVNRVRAALVQNGFNDLAISVA